MSGSGVGNGWKCARRVVVAGARHADVFVDRRLALALELQGQDVFEDVELDADQLQDRRQRDGVLDQVALGARARAP